MRSGIKSLARHTAVYGIGDLLGRSVAVVLLPVYARVYTESENGLIGLSFAFLGLCTVLYTLGLNQALVRVLGGGADAEDEARRTRFSTTLVFLAAVALFASTLMWSMSGLIAERLVGGRANADIVRMVAAILLLDTLSEPFFTLCRSRQRSLRYAVTRLCQHGLQIGLVLYLILVEGRGVRAVFEANVVSSVFALVAIAPSGYAWLRPRFSTAELRPLLRFGLPFVPSALSMLVINLADRFLVEHYLGLKELGVYVVAYKLGIPMLLIVRAFRSAWAPGVLAADNVAQGRALCARVATYYTLASLLFLLGTVAYSRELIVLVAGANAPRFLPAQDVVPLVTLGYVIYGFYVILTAGVFTEGRAGTLPLIIGAGAVVNIALNVVFIPRVGYIAAAWSTVGANVTMVALLFAFTRSFYPIPFEYARLGKVAIAAGAVCGILLGFRADASLSGTVARTISLLGFPIILWGSRFLDAQEWQEIRALLKSSGPRDSRPDAGRHVGG